LLHNGFHFPSWFKENLVPNEPAPNKIPEEALNAFLDGILAELSSPPDPAMLTMVRSIFRKRIPLHMRSYAAALLILRAAGITRTQPQKPIALAAKAPKEPLSAKPTTTQKPAVAPKPATTPKPAAAAKTTAATKPVRSAPAGEQPEGQKKPEPQKSGEGMVPLFVSMGKRQRLRPQELRTLICEKTGLVNDDLGRVHLFDNYSFIDVPEILAEKIITASDGSSYKGRTIEIKPAKKRGDQPQEKEQDE
jgi:hypothetical protein